MRNPIITKPLWLTLYLIWWILPGSIHSFVLMKAFDLNTNMILLDSIISFSVFAVFGLSIWFMVRFSSFDIDNRQKSLQNLIIAMVLIFVFWTGITYLIMSILFTNYSPIFYDTLIWRGLLFLPVYLLIIAMYFLLSSQEKISNHELVESRMQTLIKETELNALKSQINPHFLFNSLNSASSLTVYDPVNARKMIVMISDFFRGSLMMGKKPFHTIAEEIDHALLYLEIEKARFGDKINIEINLPEEIKKVYIPSLLLQPIVENAVKHGVYESSIPILIKFNFTQKADGYEIRISNNLDSDAGNSGKGTGTGLKNVASRLELAFDKKDLLVLKNSENEFVVKIFIPTKLNLESDE